MGWAYRLPALSSSSLLYTSAQIYVFTSNDPTSSFIIYLFYEPRHPAYSFVFMVTTTRIFFLWFEVSNFFSRTFFYTKKKLNFETNFRSMQPFFSRALKKAGKKKNSKASILLIQITSSSASTSSTNSFVNVRESQFSQLKFSQAVQLCDQMRWAKGRWSFVFT